MKIVILTLPLHTNYGGILQCYALQKVLIRMGHDVKVLSRPKYGRLHFIRYPLEICKRIFRHYFLGDKNHIFKNYDEIARKSIDNFIKRNIDYYKCRNWAVGVVKNYDAIVVGSDQIWRPAYSNPIENAFLSFLGDSKIKRISYAASFGVDYCEYSEDKLKVCSSLLKKFNAISVREYSGVELCRNKFGVEAVQMLDPTLLLDADNYRDLIAKSTTKPSEGNMLVYILDKTEEKVNLVNKIASDRHLTPFWLDSPDEQNESSSLNKKVKMSIEQWLRSFDDAEFVFTDSFHGCVFSIIFKKQFLAIGNRERGVSRFISLLKLFSLEEKLILSSDEYKRCLSFIDFDELYKKLFILQEQSISFLKTNLMQ